MASHLPTRHSSGTQLAQGSAHGARHGHSRQHAQRPTQCAALMAEKPPMLGDKMRPDAEGRFGTFGGKYVPETLMPALAELDKAYKEIAKDESFQVRLRSGCIWHTCSMCALLCGQPRRRHCQAGGALCKLGPPASPAPTHTGACFHSCLAHAAVPKTGTRGCVHAPSHAPPSAAVALTCHRSPFRGPRTHRMRPRRSTRALAAACPSAATRRARRCRRSSRRS